MRRGRSSKSTSDGAATPALSPSITSSSSTSSASTFPSPQLSPYVGSPHFTFAKCGYPIPIPKYTPPSYPEDGEVVSNAKKNQGKKPSGVTKPRNAFLLFRLNVEEQNIAAIGLPLVRRAEAEKSYKEQKKGRRTSADPIIRPTNRSDVATYPAIVWAELSLEEKLPWEQFWEQERQLWAQAYPGYRFLRSTEPVWTWDDTDPNRFSPYLPGEEPISASQITAPPPQGYGAPLSVRDDSGRRPNRNTLYGSQDIEDRVFHDSFDSNGQKAYSGPRMFGYSLQVGRGTTGSPSAYRFGNHDGSSVQESSEMLDADGMSDNSDDAPIPLSVYKHYQNRGQDVFVSNGNSGNY